MTFHFPRVSTQERGAQEGGGDQRGCWPQREACSGDHHPLTALGAALGEGEAGRARSQLQMEAGAPRGRPGGRAWRGEGLESCLWSLRLRWAGRAEGWGCPGPAPSPSLSGLCKLKHERTLIR